MCMTGNRSKLSTEVYSVFLSETWVLLAFKQELVAAVHVLLTFRNVFE